MPYEIKLATARDAGGVAECVCRAFIDYIPLIGKQPQPMLDDYQALISHHSVYVVAEDSKVVGVLVVGETEDGFCIETLATHPEVQGIGIGKKLISFAENMARQRRYDSIYLTTNIHMLKSQAIYSHLGFVECGKSIVGGYQRMKMQKIIP